MGSTNYTLAEEECVRMKNKKEKKTLGRLGLLNQKQTESWSKEAPAKVIMVKEVGKIYRQAYSVQG